MAHTLRLVAYIMMCGLLSTPALAVTYQIHYLPGPDTYSVAYGINNHGQIVGRLGNDPVLWDTDGIVHTLPMPTGASWMLVRNINDSGLMVGGEWWGYGAVWASNGSLITGGSGYYGDVNRNGVVAGWVGNSAVTWTTSGTHNLESLSDWVGSSAYAINNYGAVVGTAYVGDGAGGNTTHSFLWKANGDILEVKDSVSRATFASDINDLGQVVGVYDSGAYVWSPGSNMVNIGHGTAYGIDNSGVVVGSFYGASSWNHAFVWTAESGQVDLGLGAAYGINDAGWIVGYAGISGRAVVWEPVPEPSSCIALLLALGISVAIRPRKK